MISTVLTADAYLIHRAEYVCELDAVQAEHFSKENVLSGADHWNP